MKLIDISKKLGVPEGSVRAWKKRYNWDNKTDDKNATLQRNNQVDNRVIKTQQDRREINMR